MADRKNLIFILFFLWACPAAHALTVSGNIKDVNGNPVPYVKVCLMDYNPGIWDTERDCVQTSAFGNYGSSKVQMKDNVYLLVYYVTPIDPGVPSLAPRQKLKVVHNSDSDPITFSTANHTGGYFRKLKVNAVINIPSAAGQPALGNEVRILQAIHEEFDFIRSQGVSNFRVNYDITASINTSDSNEWPHANSDEKTLHMGIDRVNGDNPEWYAMYHEVGHILQYQAYNPPRHPKGHIGWNPHTRDSHTDTGAAISEGWAEGIGDAATGAYHPPARVTSSSDWRGAGSVGKPPQNFGTPSGSDNSGEVVEGSLCEITKSSFRFMMEALVASNPDTFKEWMAGFLARSGEGPVFLQLIKTAREWGIVYSRAKFTGFEEDAPLFGGENPGNAAKVDQIIFLRGLIHPKYAQNSKGELNLQADTIGIEEIKMGYKPAENGLDRDLYGMDWRFDKWTAAVPFGNRIEFKTEETFDQDLDLILEVKDVHGSWDDFNPTFAGDPIPPGAKDYSSDERWLKHLGTWYNQDDFADNDNEGKVILDNNEPVIRDKTFKPVVEGKNWITGGNGIYVRISPPAPKS